MNTMTAILLHGYGDASQQHIHHDVPLPILGDDEVLIKVMAAGLNNTDINTRVGWYSKKITGDTASATEHDNDIHSSDAATWSGQHLSFPHIQGADCAGIIVEVGANISNDRVGDVVMVRSMQQVNRDVIDYRCKTLGSEYRGAFAQYTKTLSVEAYKLNSTWSYSEIATIPCSYSTAENLLIRMGLGKGKVVITGASGGVGSAAIQLAKLRGAHVIAIASPSKHDALRDLGADETYDRHADLPAILGEESVDYVVDVVAGDAWSQLIAILKRGGKYGTSGAIAGPLVTLDVRDLYLKDLSFYGATYQSEEAFLNLVSYIQQNRIKPLVAATYPLHDIAKAQEHFLRKDFIGNIVLIPSHDNG